MSTQCQQNMQFWIQRDEWRYQSTKISIPCDFNQQWVSDYSSMWSIYFMAYQIYADRQAIYLQHCPNHTIHDKFDYSELNSKRTSLISNISGHFGAISIICHKRQQQNCLNCPTKKFHRFWLMSFRNILAKWVRRYWRTTSKARLQLGHVTCFVCPAICILNDPRNQIKVVPRSRNTSLQQKFASVLQQRIVLSWSLQA